MRFYFQLLLAVLIMVIFLHFSGPVSFTAGPFEYDMKMIFSGQGETVIHFPPLGRVAASTHLPPLEFHLYLSNIEIDGLTAMVSENESWEQILKETTGLLKLNVLKYSSLMALLSFLIGTGTFLLINREQLKIKNMLYLGVLNSLVFLFFVSSAMISYQPGELSRARYEGAIEAAPLVYSILNDGYGVVSGIGQHFTSIVNSISYLKEEMANFPEINESILSENINKSSDTINILHVSDIHNNPSAFQFIQRINDSHDVDLIIDTGDLVDYGTALEAEKMLSGIENLKIPYVFIPGNHESPVVVEYLKSNDNIIVLEKGIVKVSGITIAGISDPSAKSTQMSVAEEEMDQYARKLKELVYKEKDVDIVAVHNPKLLRYVKNKNYLLLSGHVHTPYIDKMDDYIEINAGTTGASGIRGIKNKRIDFSLFLLGMQPGEATGRMKLKTADLISISHFPLKYSFERHVFE